MSEAITKREAVEVGRPHGPEEGNIASLVELAIREKVDVSVLERLVALQERVQERDARMAFFEAVAKAQEEFPEVRKTQTAKIATNSGSNYSYTFAPLEEVTRAIRPVLKRHGLSYSFDAEMANGGVLNVVCVLRHIEGHEERAHFPVPTATSAKMSDAQKNGAALTYGRRQSLIAVLGLTTADGDSDGVERHRPGPATITDAQLADLESLISEVGADRAKFLAYLQVEKLSDLHPANLPNATQALERKRGSA